MIVCAESAPAWTSSSSVTPSLPVTIDSVPPSGPIVASILAPDPEGHERVVVICGRPTARLHRQWLAGGIPFTIIGCGAPPPAPAAPPVEPLPPAPSRPPPVTFAPSTVLALRGFTTLPLVR